MSRFPGSLPLPEEFPLPEPLSRSRHILGIWAHPDDECYLSAGVMARMAEAGRRVTVLTATRGEKGTSDPADHDTAHFAARREGELRASLGVLGVHDVRFLGMMTASATWWTTRSPSAPWPRSWRTSAPT